MKPKKKIQSSIPELTVGEERKLFNQIRKSAAYITPETLLFNGWTAGGFALTYIIQHHMKRKRKAEEKTSDQDGNKRQKISPFDDPVTITSLDEKDSVKPKAKRKAVPKKTAPPPPELVRQTNEGVELEFVEVKSVAEANQANKKKIQKPKVPEKKEDPVAKKTRKKPVPQSPGLAI